MATKPYEVLFLEDNMVSATFVVTTLSKELPEVEFVTAINIAEARKLARERNFDLYILDVQLPDGNSIDFLCDVQKEHEVPRAIFMTASRLPEFRRKAEEAGAVRFFEKPLKIKEFSQLVRELLQSKAPSQAETHFKGTLSCLTPMDLVQLKCLSRATIGLEFLIPEGKQGRVYFNKGEVVHAEVGSIQGEDAFYLIMGWKRGEVSETKPLHTAPTIKMPWANLIMNAAQHLDETSAQA